MCQREQQTFVSRNFFLFDEFFAMLWVVLFVLINSQTQCLPNTFSAPRIAEWCET